MKKLIAFSAIILTFNLSAAPKGQLTYETPEAAAALDPDFSIQGEYTGEGVDGSGENHQLGLQIVALGEGTFQATAYKGGLPGAGWDGETKWVYTGKRKGKIKATFANDESPIALHYNNGKVIAAKGDQQVGSFTRTTRKPKTIGLNAPKGAKVLFNGKDNGSLDKLQVTKDGLMKEGAITKDKFQSFKLHAEFRLPFKPTARGQARGNSGLYLQRRYELQVLDSFGIEMTPAKNDCGCLYKQKYPDVNACFPPLTWQTYDVDFTAARFDDAGKRTAPARITAHLNGILIHDDYALKNKTGAGQKEGATPGPIWFQNHSNPVRYRNVWIQEK
jgi:hypothetical protein